jgi:hypothetical protein
MKILRESAFERILLLLFGTGSIVFYGFFNCQHLYQKEQLQLFEVTCQYFITRISHHGGLADWFGEFFVEFFHIPWAGAIIITLFFFILQFLTKKILEKTGPNKPLILFSFLPALGYLIILQDDYYSVSGVAGLIISLLAALMYLNIKEHHIRGVAGMLILMVVYWVAGGAYLVYTFIIIVSELVFRFKRKEIQVPVHWTFIFVYLILGVLLPVIARELILKDTLLQSYLSESYYRIRIFFPAPLVLIFISIPLFIIIQQFFPGKLFENGLSAINLIAIIILFALTVWGVVHFSDFKSERRKAYENLVYKNEWEKIIKRAEREHPSDRLSMIAVNLALAKTGELSSKMFSFDQGKDRLFTDYERRGMTPFIASEPYYHLGLYNFAQMFAMETIESTPDMKFPSRSFKRVAETFIINGQYDIALKYLVPLSHTLFHGKWAKECIHSIKDRNKISVDPYWNSLRDLRSGYDFYYNFTQQDIPLKYLLISNQGNKTAYEYLMAYFLLQKDLDGFLAYLPLAGKLNYNELPLAWQEAAVYIRTRVSQVPPQLENYSIREDVIDHIKSYAQQYSGSRPDSIKMHKEFGNTYWYYLHFK